MHQEYEQVQSFGTHTHTSHLAPSGLSLCPWRVTAQVHGLVLPPHHPGHLDAMQLFRPHVDQWLRNSRESLRDCCSRQLVDARGALDGSAPLRDALGAAAGGGFHLYPHAEGNSYDGSPLVGAWSMNVFGGVARR